MTSSEIRKAYIDFFVQRHGHTFVPSSPVVPHDDPTLLFTNAGMNQFKPIFLGQEKRPYTRAVNTQKCIRAGGKHNDLDDVGRSRRHHTFFEMLGNWSFGDYFKQGAIEMAWELITQVLKFDPERIHVTCYEGDEKAGIPRDTEAAAIWKRVAGLPDDHIHFLGKENFWEMGDTGPCGPSTEIFIDRTPDKTGGPSVEKDDDPRVMEFWNNVFIQYNRDASGKLTPLPAQHVDTGMGFERMCSILQDVDSNYSIDLFNPFWAKLKELSGHTYGGKFPKTNVADAVAEAADEGLRKDIAFRVIADHVRCLTFAITDGAAPSNEGRGYVLRRILRRAVRFGRQQLGLREPFMHTLVPVVVEAMGGMFPEVVESQQRVIELVREEEVSFGETLDRGIERFDYEAWTAFGEAIVGKSDMNGIYVPHAGLKEREGYIELGNPPNQRRESVAYNNPAALVGLAKRFKATPIIPAQAAFKLHDTYGFPIDLTRIMAEERGMTVDLAGYEKLMEEAKDKARAGGKGEESKLNTLPPAALDQIGGAGIEPTDDAPKYSHDTIEARVVALWDGSEVVLAPGQSSKSNEVAVLLDRTNFYAEMGGQVGDTGDLWSASKSPNSNIVVGATKAVGGYVLHIGLAVASPSVGDTVRLDVNPARKLTEKNHTSTHLANWALREVLGDGVQQKGSLVDAEKLRFDFSHGKALSDEELAKVQGLVERAIVKELPVYAQEAPQEQALKINGLRAVFGEKYPPLVRVVSVGVPVDDLLKDPTNDKWRAYSIEFCGGTHLKSSKDAGAFVIVEESSVSKGIRRIVALTGDAARDAIQRGNAVDAAIKENDLPGLQKALSAAGVPLRAKRRGQASVADLQAKAKQAEKSASSTSGTIDAAAAATKLLEAATDLAGGKLIVAEIPTASDDTLRAAMDSLKKRLPSLALMLASSTGEKVTFLAAVSDDLIAKGLKAGDWVRETAKIAGGSGGGRPQMAQAGAKDPAKLSAALTRAREFATATIK